MNVHSLSNTLRRNLDLPGSDLLTYDELAQALAPHGFTFCPIDQAPSFIEDWLSAGKIEQWVALIYRKPTSSSALIRALWFIGLSSKPASAQNARHGALEAVYQAVLSVLSKFPACFLAPGNC